MFDLFDQAFLIKLVLSFLVSGAWAVFALKIAEKTGTKLGSIILSLPSTTLFALLFIGWIQGMDAVAQAASVSLGMIGIVAMFLLIFVKLLDRFKLSALLFSILAWFVLSVILLHLSLGIFQSFLAGVLLFIVSFIALRSIKSKTTKIESTDMQMLTRFMLVGSLVSISIIISKLAGPQWGGVFATFPAMFASSLYVSYNAYGIKFTKAMAANTTYAFPGFFTYVLGVYFLYPICGLVLGTILSFIISLITIYIFNLIFKR
ncbi:MAG: DUF3147 family protein [Candidatus Micrarchaeota archaeon]